jgi:radical SAM superfamily enzyme YgiQ (UPF0313 family)
MKLQKPTVFPLVLAKDFNTLPYLSLGMITAYLRQHESGTLNNHFHVNRLRLGGVEGFPLEDVYREVNTASHAICLLSSYVWNHEINTEAARVLKEQNPDALIIVGGPEIPKYRGETELYLKNHPYIDIAVLGEGEMACAQILSAIANDPMDWSNALGQVPGIVFQSQGAVTRTGERDRLRHIEQLPSPYLTGEFEPWFKGFVNTILETNRGCPYGCTYCDWGSATLQKVSKFDPDRVAAEIDYIAQSKAESIFIADANFGMLEQDIQIAKSLIDAKARTGYPKRVYTNFAKNGGRRLMTTIKILHEGGLLPIGIIALQTTDEDVLKTIKRDNIRTSSYEKMMEYFNSENIPMASDIMIGLPGQTVDVLEKDLQFCFDWKVSANGNYTSMMPNAPMAESHYKAENMIVTDSNNMVESTSTFTANDLKYMKSYYSTYLFFVKLAILKYYLYFLQIDYKIPALRFLRLWLDRVLENDASLVISRQVYREVFDMDSRTGDWAMITWGEKARFLFSNIEEFFEEIHQFTVREFGVAIPENQLQAIFKAQAAVMPHLNRSYPYTVDLEHDVDGYFRQLLNVPSLKHLDKSVSQLSDFQSMRFSAGKGTDSFSSISFSKIIGHADEGWELDSSIRFY